MVIITDMYSTCTLIELDFVSDTYGCKGRREYHTDRFQAALSSVVVSVLSIYGTCATHVRITERIVILGDTNLL